MAEFFFFFSKRDYIRTKLVLIDRSWICRILTNKRILSRVKFTFFLKQKFVSNWALFPFKFTFHFFAFMFQTLWRGHGASYGWSPKSHLHMKCRSLSKEIFDSIVGLAFVGFCSFFMLLCTITRNYGIFVPALLCAPCTSCKFDSLVVKHPVYIFIILQNPTLFTTGNSTFILKPLSNQY